MDSEIVSEYDQEISQSQTADSLVLAATHHLKIYPGDRDQEPRSHNLSKRLLW